MIRFLKPQYYTNYDYAWSYGENTKTRLHDMYFRDEFGSISYDYIDFGIDTSAGVERRARIGYYYDVSNLSVKNVKVPLRIQCVNRRTPEFSQAITVGLLSTDAYGNNTQELVSSQTLECTGNSMFDAMNFELRFDFSVEFSNKKFLLVLINAHIPDDTYGKGITIYAPVIEVDGTGTGATKYRSHLPRDMKNEIRSLKESADRYAARFYKKVGSVNFYDYTGEILYSYTSNEFLSLAALPPNPVHKGLTAQGWNWTLTDAQDYVRKYGHLNIGQMYITDDGATRLYVHVPDEFLDFELAFNTRTESSNGSFFIDWGDGSPESSSKKHTYDSAGDYVISIRAVDCTIKLETGAVTLWTSTCLLGSSSRLQPAMLQRVEIGENTVIGDNAFSGCSRLKSISLPSTLTEITLESFSGCSSLNGIVIPSSVIRIGYMAFAESGITYVSLPKNTIEFGFETESAGYCFLLCKSLTDICMPEMEELQDTILGGCTSLENVVLADSIQVIGTNVLSSCSSLTSITIPKSTSRIGNSAFEGCSSLRSICLADNVEELGTGAFRNCTALRTIHFSDKIKSIQNETFKGCTQLSSLYIPDGITAIGDEAFAGCSNLSEISLPASLASLGAYVFNDCPNLKRIVFRGDTPPENISDYAWYRLQHTYWIQVPEGCTEIYQSNENMPVWGPYEGDPIYTESDGSLLARVDENQLILTGPGAVLTDDGELTLASSNANLDDENHLVFD